MNNVQALIQRKDSGNKIAMLTCYDYTSALIVQETEVDCVLVGDSSVMVMQGAANTLSAKVEQIAWHTEAVARGIKDKLLVVDMPFMSYHRSKSETLAAVETLARAGAEVVKLEGASPELVDTIKSIIATGIPVMGHLGMTPQHIHQFGGFKVQGRSEAAREMIIEQAKMLEEAGVCGIVLECIPADLAHTITELVSVPTIGIGAGNSTDGQVLVFQDLLGLQKDFTPKFVKQYLNGAELFAESISTYVSEVRSQAFPAADNVYEG